MMKYLCAVIVAVSFVLGRIEARSGYNFFHGGDSSAAIFPTRPSNYYHRQILQGNAQAAADMYDMNTWFDNVLNHCLHVVARR